MSFPDIPAGMKLPLVDDATERLPTPTMEAIAAAPEVAVAMANPESALNGATVEVVEGVLGGGVAGMMKVVDARGVPSTVRPTWAGIVEWWVDEGQGIPIHLESGDVVREVSTEPIPFSPLDLNPIAWYDAVAITGLANDATVTTWENLVTTGPDAAAVSGTVLYKSAGLNAGPSLYATNARMNAEGFSAFGEPVTVVIVGKVDSLSATNRTAIDALSTSDNSNRLVVRVEQTMYGMTRDTGFSAGTSDTNPHLFEAVFNGESSALYVDTAEPLAGSTGTSSTDTIVLFNRGDSARPWVGHIGCVIVVPGLLSTDQRADLRAYLNERYTLGLSL